MKKYYAHSTGNADKSDWQELSEHLLAVGKKSEKFSSAFHAEDWGRVCGILHDIGKASREFIRRLEGENIRAGHSIHGARQAHKRYDLLGTLLAYVLAGHHGGLPDGGDQEGQLHYRLRHERVPEADAAAVEALLASLPPELRPPFCCSREEAGFVLAFFTRMLFSCLVDADFLDTEKFCDREKSLVREVRFQSISELKARLGMFMAAVMQKAEKSGPEGRVNTLRTEILTQCRTRALQKPGFFTLSVPTGGGKTLSSLAFALEHAVLHKKRRVIYAIPFTSIIEQNAQIFCTALGQENILEHHYNYAQKESPETAYERWRGLAVENWDAPVVVTTNVQFFESLFANKSSRCRKLHNIAESVIILDEVQAIPAEYLEPSLAALRELVTRYGCSVVLCTATQPALDASSLQMALHDINPIVLDSARYFAELERTNITFLGSLDDASLARRLDDHEQVLCITATKPQARAVFEQLQNTEGAYHLSTNMYPAHRRRVLKEIRSRLQDGLPCRVVSTSLVEAGVDISLPVVYRALAGLDSIAQAAGRCNRNGELWPELGQVFLFEPEKLPAMPWLRRCATTTKEVLRNLPKNVNPLSEAAIRRYFELLYSKENLDKQGILPRLRQAVGAELIFPFREIANSFKMIQEEGVTLIIALEEEAQKYVEALRWVEFPRPILRKLQQYSVSLRTRDFQKLRAAVEMLDGCDVEMVNGAKGEYAVLRNPNAYDAHVGLKIDSAEVWEPADLVL